ncbi:HPr kinase/phosphorylase [Sphingomonas oligophenolica]|uniref:HPr kinase/phosphorylase n=1 Tax=Sphingomonas oligophenolica TaxID=301154 RepID=UPI001F4FE3E1|nr:aldolase [Sphingomonas oligophenolica]
MTTISSESLHATSVAIDGQAVVIEGPSGSGKSDLALRLIDRGAALISDDITLIVRVGGVLRVRTPDSIPAAVRARMEVRGVGIVAVPYADDVPLALVVRLDHDVPRMPERRARLIAGVEAREVLVDPRPASAPILVELALRQPEATPG